MYFSRRFDYSSSGVFSGAIGTSRPAMRYVKRRVGCSFLFLRYWLALGRFLFCKLTVPPASSTCYPHMCFTVPDDLFVCPEEERAHPFYQAGSVQLTQGRVGHAPFQISFP